MVTNTLKYFTIPILFLLINFNLVAQAPIKQSTITGKVVDESKEVLPYVLVKLYKVNDSSLVVNAQTDINGIFSFVRQPRGSYYVEIYPMGYMKKSISPIAITEGATQNHDLGTIILLTQTQELNTIEIRSKKPLIERRDGKTIINVSSSVLAAGSTAMEILTRVPGVSLDNQGNVSLRGKPGASIMIDGKPTHLSSAQLANLLRSTDGNAIQTIEIVSNPSAKYDAAGTGGIINIKLKKNTSNGTNGTFSLGGGMGNYYKSNAGITLNHRNGSFNIYGNYNYGNNRQFEDLLLTRSSRPADNLTFFDQKASEISKRENNNYKAGVDYFIDKNNTIGFMVSGYLNKYSGDNGINTIIGSQPGRMDSTVLGQNQFMGQYKNQTFNLNYRSVLDTLGKEFNADLDYSTVHNMENATYQNDFLSASGAIYRSPFIFRNATPSKIGILAGKLDYTLRLHCGMKLETGLKSSFVTTDNDFRSELRSQQGWQNNESQSNRFSYRENVNAAYVNVHKEIGSSSLQLGLRSELTHSEGNSVTLNSETVRNYIDFFPSVLFQHALSKDKTIDFSYSRRIDRPSYQSLNPFVYYSDLFTMSKGNPMLKPQYASAYEVNYRRNKLNISLGYIRTKDVITTTLLTDTIKKSITLYEQNLSSRRTFSIAINRTIDLTDWWSSINDATVYNSSFTSPELLGGPFKNQKTTLELNSINTFKLSPSINMELSGNYTSSQVYGTYIAKPIYGLDLGFGKSFANERANLKLSVTDLFNQRQISIRSAITNQDYQLSQKQESRVFRLTFSYNFGSKIIKATRSRSNIFTDEQERVKSGK